MTFHSAMRPTQSTYPRFDQPSAQPEGQDTMDWDMPGHLAMQQLRHHTKNALQRVVAQVAACPGLQRDPAGRALANELERRIHLSASLSDALFGFTQAPGPLDVRLRALGEAVISLMADGDQMIDLIVGVDGVCPAAYHDTLVRVAHELVGNAVKHGMHLRLVGRIEIVVEAGHHGVTLSVIDDGWGPCVNAGRGDGLRIARLLGEQLGGILKLDRENCQTVATLALPPAVATTVPGMVRAREQ